MKCYRIAIVWDKVEKMKSDAGVMTQMYRIYFRGRLFALPLFVCTRVQPREKVRILKKKK